MKGEPNFHIHHIGETEEEKKGVINFFKSIENDTLSLTGGDPLRNETVLELAIKYHKGPKEIIINPLTFLCLALNKPSDKITEEEAIEIIDKIKQEGLSPEIKRLTHLISKFDIIFESLGSLQGPNPKIKELANRFYKEFILPEIMSSSEKKPKIEDYSVHGRYESGCLVKSNYDNVACVGRLRQLIEEGKFKTKMSVKSTGREPKVMKCREKDTLSLYFKKEDGKARLFFTLCCRAGATPYTSFKTELTLEKMATTTPQEINEAIKDECKKMEETSFHRMLNEPIKENDYDQRFTKYLKAAETLIKKKTGEDIDIVENTYTLGGGDCGFCECCNTVGVMLHRHGISVSEWHKHLENF